MIVRNEAAIIADSIGHLLHGVGVDRLFVADNGSTDATPAILARIAAVDPRVAVRDAPGAFQQAETIAGLIAEAAEGGETWVLPTDADEFLWVDAATLRARCAAAHGLGGFRLRMTNFVQWRTVARDRPGSIETMVARAIPDGGPEDMRERVCDGRLPFIRIPFPPKLLIRARAAVSLNHGMHDVTDPWGPLPTADFAEILHAPMRARDDLTTRVEHGRRVRDRFPDPNVSWHVKRLVDMDGAALDAEWRANSISADPRTWTGMRPDPRLRRVGRRLRRFRAAMQP